MAFWSRWKQVEEETDIVISKSLFVLFELVSFLIAPMPLDVKLLLDLPDLHVSTMQRFEFCLIKFLTVVVISCFC